MKASNFQFLNPYLEEMFFAGNDNFDMNEDIEMENSFTALFLTLMGGMPWLFSRLWASR